MKGNPTAGILLLIGASLLIVVGMTNKGKQIIAVLTGTASAPSTGQGTTQQGTLRRDPNNVQNLDKWRR